MKQFTKQLKKQSQTVRMSAAEKHALRERLVTYMEYHPMPHGASESQAAAPRAGVVSYFHMVSVRTLARFAGVAMVALLVAVPFTAEYAVPGDVLYPVKIRFNEEVLSTLTLTPYEKVEWETKRLERRIAEARLLASEGKLTPEAQADVQRAVQNHSNAAQKEIAVIAEKDKDEAAIAGIAFSAALEVQSEVLESDRQKGNADSGLEGVVTAAREVASSTTAAAAPPSYEKLAARIEIETTKATEFYASISDIVSEENKETIKNRLARISLQIQEATKLHADADAEADASIAVLTQALADTRKLISFMTDLEVQESVEVEDLVPEQEATPAAEPEVTDEESTETASSTDEVIEEEEEVVRTSPTNSATLLNRVKEVTGVAGN